VAQEDKATITKSSARTDNDFSTAGGIKDFFVFISFNFLIIDF
jgi:hypothetical protein